MNCYSTSSNIDWVAFGALIVAFVSAVVAIVSVIISVRYNRDTFNLVKEHNKKTVEPLVSDFFILDAMGTKGKNSIATYKIKNCGLGPAIIKSLNFTINDIKYEHVFDIYKKKIGEPKYDKDLSSIFYLEDNHVLAANESITLFDFHFLDLNSYLEFQKVIKNAYFSVDYETIYGEKRKFVKEILSKY
jgi:hypothetical protein